MARTYIKPAAHVVTLIRPLHLCAGSSLEARDPNGEGVGTDGPAPSRQYDYRWDDDYDEE